MKPVLETSSSVPPCMGPLARMGAVALKDHLSPKAYPEVAPKFT